MTAGMAGGMAGHMAGGMAEPADAGVVVAPNAAVPPPAVPNAAVAAPDVPNAAVPAPDVPNAAVPAPVVLRLPAVLRELVSGHREVDVRVGSRQRQEGTTGDLVTLGDVLDEVDAQWPVLGRRLRDETGALRRYVNVYVDGEDVRAGDGVRERVRPGAIVDILPSIAGG
ncbi:MAG: MoaD/ThiS family protein [Actinomycetales bacterium]